MRRRSQWAMFLLVAVVILVVRPVMAQESAPAHASAQNSSQHALPKTSGETGEEGSEGFKHSPAVQWIARNTGMSVMAAYWVAMLINFLIVAGFIYAVSRSRVPAMLRARTEAIQQGMKEARAASDDARRRLGEVESRLAKLDSEIAELRTAAEKEAQAEEARIRVAAEEDVRKVLQAAEQEIDAASRQARRELKSLAAGLAVDLAEKKLKVDKTTDQALVRQFVRQLGEDGE